MPEARQVARFFDGPARAKVAAAVAAAEARTTGQIVPLVVARSANYQPFWVAAGPFAVAFAALTLFEALGWEPASDPLPRLGGVLAWLAVAAFPPFQRLLVRRFFAAAVQQRALAAFAEQGVAHTQGETGVLIFLSLYERRAVILGDRAIHARIGDDGWRTAVELLTSRLAAGDPAGGFVAAIEDIGAQLAAAFPRAAPAGANELSDELRIEGE